MSTFIFAAAFALAACQPGYVPACRLAASQTALDLTGPLPAPGLSAGAIALSVEPGGRVLARWWRPVEAQDAGASYPAGPTAELAVLESSGSEAQRASVLMPDAWEGAPGRNPARPFVKTADGVAAVVAQTRARIQPDMTVQLRTFLRFTSVWPATGATSMTDLSDSSCIDCELWASMQRVEPANAVLLAQWPSGESGSDNRLGAMVMTVDDEGLVLARMSIADAEPLPALLPRTPPDALALLSGPTLRLWNAALTPAAPAIELGAHPGALDWDLATSELVAGTSDAQNVFFEFLAWSGAGRAERYRASAGAGVFAVARGAQGPAMVFGDGEQVYFAHVDEQGHKRGPDVPLAPLDHGGPSAQVDGRGVLVELKEAPGSFAYFSPSPAGVDRYEVRCE